MPGPAGREPLLRRYSLYARHRTLSVGMNRS
jgi:hypothetical protein